MSKQVVAGALMRHGQHAYNGEDPDSLRWLEVDTDAVLSALASGGSIVEALAETCWLDYDDAVEVAAAQRVADEVTEGVRQ